MRIAIFGGSFNPPHLGHVLCAVYAQKMGNVDEVWVMPSADHPYGKDLLSWEARWQLCEAAFAGLDFVKLRHDELENDGGKTYNLVQHLKKMYPDNTWFLIGGTDVAEDMPNWYHGYELQEMVELIAVPRQGFDNGSATALPAISSTEIRNRLARGMAIDDLVPLAVERLIAEQQFYQAAK